MRSTPFPAVLAVFALAAFALIASENKIDDRLLEKARTEAAVEVIVYLADPDPAFDPESIKQPYRERLDTIAGEIRALRESTEAAAKKNGTRDPNAELELADLRAALDFELEAMRREVGRAAENGSREGLELLANGLRLLGAEIRGTIYLTNAIAVRIPSESLAQLAAMPEVAAVYPDQAVVGELDVSVTTCGFPTWWAETYSGEGTDFGIVDSGVFETHPAFAHVPNMHGRPGDNVTHTHGTGVTGVVAMEFAANIGAAHDLDAVVWAHVGPWASTALTAMQWVAWQAPEVPEVINLSQGVGVPPQDISDFEMSVDALIDSQDLLLTKSAGNEGWDNTWSTLTSPGRAYNTITVAGMNDMGTVSRTDDARYIDSSVGPTPAGRRKPDLTAPAEYITLPFWPSGYAYYTGTSFAAPHVAAAVMLLSQEGNWDAMAQKAVLINTAEPWYSFNTATGVDDTGSPWSHWDKSYGWGYLDMDRAWEERDKYVTGELWPKGSSGGPSARYYKLTMNLYDRATLVWHRHVKYTFWGTQYRNLVNMGLSLYNDANHTLVDADNTTLDNVHQVQSDIGSSFPAVVKVYTNDTAFDGIAKDRFALAGVSPGKLKWPPKGYWFIVDGPVWVHPLDPVTVKFSIQNTGELTAHDNHLTVDYGRTGIVPADGNTGPRALPSLQPGETVIYELDLLADVPAGDYELTASLVFSSYDEAFPADDLTILVEVPRH